jgi:hypothetical protein
LIPTAFPSIARFKECVVIPLVKDTLMPSCSPDRGRFKRTEAMNWVSTQVPLWQIDCETFRKAELPFELRDVGAEHESFISMFAARYDLDFKQVGKTVDFSPKKRRKKAKPPSPG